MTEADSKLLETVRAAFPDAGPCPCEITGCEPDTLDIRRAFQGRPWATLTDRDVDRHWDALFMLDPAPLAHYLPAFLSRVARDRDTSTTDYLMGFLASDGFRGLVGVLSPAQVEACFAVAESVFDRDEGVYTDECEAVMRLREEIAGERRTETTG